jgi:hypothetical protein
VPTFDPTFEADLGQVGKYEVTDAAVAAAAAHGIRQHGPSMWFNQQTQQWEQDQEQLPPDLARLGDDDLGSWLGRITARLGHVGDMLPIAESQMRAAKKELGFISSKLYRLYKYDEQNKKATEQERKSCMTVDQRYIDADVRADFCETYYDILKQAYANLEQDYTAVSRRISQRQQDVERDRRGHNVNTALPATPVFRRPPGM